MQLRQRISTTQRSLSFNSLKGGGCACLPFSIYMKRSYGFIAALALLLAGSSCKEQPVELPTAILSSFSFCGKSTSVNSVPVNVPLEGVYMDFEFTKPLDIDAFDPSLLLVSGCSSELFAFSVTGEDRRTLHVGTVAPLPAFSRISLRLCAGKNLGVNLPDELIFSFTTEYDPSDKFPRISRDELFEKVQKAAFLYFWDYAHPVSGLARERKGSGDTVTSGGSGFALMTIPVAIERGWISREEGLAHCLKVLDFLKDKSERFHGAWSHWLDGNSGKAIAFSTYDDGGDLVETAFMIQGILTLRQYFSHSDEDETRLRALATELWEGVEWSWYRRDGENQLYWHWSPNVEWKMNMPIRGWNEALIVYVLAASSPTYPIDKAVYDEGWANGGALRNGRNFFGVTLPLGQDYGGPMFFAHYSFLGLDPRHLKDAYADYWEQNCAHAFINWKYCAGKPANCYSESCWGLTASDYSKGYTASSPTNDRGTIAPTAALASYPYLPEQSAAAMEYFYYVLGDRLWGEYGFHDAFSLRDRWFADSYIAIDQGPIVVMMENARTGLLWDNFMRDSDVQAGLSKLGFSWE